MAVPLVLALAALPGPRRSGPGDRLDRSMDSFPQPALFRYTLLFQVCHHTAQAIETTTSEIAGVLRADTQRRANSSIGLWLGATVALVQHRRHLTE